MFPECSGMLEARLASVEGKVILNVGSNTWEHYHDQQPWIWERVIGPLLGRGNFIVNLDRKVEVVALPHRLFHWSMNVLDGLPGEAADIVLCTSTIEHVERPGRLIEVMRYALRPGGMLWLEAPSVYPIHHDPIDNGVRPRNEEECKELLGEGWEIISCEFFDAKAPFAGEGVLVGARKR